jgi:hypothetical protein
MTEADSVVGEDTEPAPGKNGQWTLRYQWTVSVIVIAGLYTIVGGLLLWPDLTILHGDTKTVILEVAVALMLFGGTTLIASVVAVTSIEKRMEARIEQLLSEETRKVVAINEKTQKIMQDTQTDLKPLGGNWRALGLTNVYLTRADALAEFGKHIRDELHRAVDIKNKRDAILTTEERAGRGERAETAGDPEINNDNGDDDDDDDIENDDDETDRPRLWIAASSMKGLLESAGEKFDGLGTFTWAAQLAASGALDLRILMTHPSVAQLRAGQEDRGDKAIPEEILEAVRLIKRERVPRKRVRMLKATPTVFAIATRDRMLLNPYPYSQEAYRSFTLTVRRSPFAEETRDHRSIERDIFEQYKHRHFDRPWKIAAPLTEEYGIPDIPNEGASLPRESGPLTEQDGIPHTPEEGATPPAGSDGR